MIAYLRGKIFDVNADHAVMMTASGVGYELRCSLGTLSVLQDQKNKECDLHVYTHVREDALSLFGFLEKAEKQIFLSLLKVNGIGPKMALNILSGGSYQQLLELIEREDVKALSQFPKVGKKTAEQMILTLKGKLVLEPAVGAVAQQAPSVHRELKSALLNLGFRANDIDKVVTDLPKDMNLESGIKTALAALTNI